MYYYSTLAKKNCTIAKNIKLLKYLRKTKKNKVGSKDEGLGNMLPKLGVKLKGLEVNNLSAG